MPLATRESRNGVRSAKRGGGGLTQARRRRRGRRLGWHSGVRAYTIAVACFFLWAWAGVGPTRAPPLSPRKTSSTGSFQAPAARATGKTCPCSRGYPLYLVFSSLAARLCFLGLLGRLFRLFRVEPLLLILSHRASLCLIRSGPQNKTPAVRRPSPTLRFSSLYRTGPWKRRNDNVAQRDRRRGADARGAPAEGGPREEEVLEEVGAVCRGAPVGDRCVHSGLPAVAFVSGDDLFG